MMSYLPARELLRALSRRVFIGTRQRHLEQMTPAYAESFLQ